MPPDAAFDYLADPFNRPAWQSSLKRVEDVDGAPRVGQTWVDVTRVGVRPLMETTELERPHRWTERGTWRGFDATLTLLRRIARGERWYQAHREHAYQRMVQAGSSHGQVTALVLVVNLGLGLLAWLAQSARLPATVAVLAGIVLLTILYLAIERRRPMNAAASDPTRLP